jgi:hypothetical protein
VIGDSRDKSCTTATITTTLTELGSLCDFDSEIFHGFESSTKKAFPQELEVGGYQKRASR